MSSGSEVGSSLSDGKEKKKGCERAKGGRKEGGEDERSELGLGLHGVLDLVEDGLVKEVDSGVDDARDEGLRLNNNNATGVSPSPPLLLFLLSVHPVSEFASDGSSSTAETQPVARQLTFST